MKHGSRLGLLVSFLVCSTVAQAADQFDFGAAGTEAGYVAVGNTTTWSAGLGYGWLSTTGLNLRDRGGPDDLHRDFVLRLSAGNNTFRVSGLSAGGKYLMKVTCGDADYGDHVIDVTVPGAGALPTMSPATSEFQTLNASVNADGSGILEITFGSPVNNWVVNALTLEPAATNVTPFIESNHFFSSTWDPAVFATDPTTNLLNGFDGTGAIGFTSTGLSRDDYLALVESEIDYWVTYQNSSGAIIDPYAGFEVQYSTPAFANAAAALVVYAGRTDLLEPAAKAMDKASLDLHNKAAAGSHEDFYAPMVANTYRLLAPLVDPSRAASWASNLDFDPYATYRADLADFNWNMISSGGEALMQLWGLRSSDNTYVDASWARQGHHFASPYGLYLEGPMCYDIFPRVYLTDALEQGYVGPYSAEMQEAMDRAAISSLFMQSPWGELPSGGRSAHHQWNEAEQCFIYEVYAGKAEAEGDLTLAAAYKRAAHLSLASMFRWVRPSGEMQIVKNWVDPASRYAYEGYSYHSQYNLMPMSMLAIAYEYAATSEDIAEGPAPSDTGGFVFAIDRLDIPSRPHKIFANAGGTYVEINSFADLSYDATGLVRVHQTGLSPQVGLTDSLMANAGYNTPDDSPITTGAGISWLDSNGTTWRTLGEMTSAQVTSITMTPVSQSTTQVVFDVTYSGSLPNVTSITEHYVVTPEGVQLTTDVAGYGGPLRYVWPVHSNDGNTLSSVSVNGSSVSVSKDGAKAIFTAVNAYSVSVGNDEYSNHNGWARLATAEYPSGGSITLMISQLEPDVNIVYKSPIGDIYDTAPALEVMIEDAQVTVDPGLVELLLDGTNVTGSAGYSIVKAGPTTTVSLASPPLSYGAHTVGVVAGPSVQTNEWSFNVLPLPPVLIGDIVYVDATSGGSGNTMVWNGAAWSTFNPPRNQSSPSDDLWEEEETGYGGYGNGPLQNWFESNREPSSGPGEDCPQLRTMVTGLTDQTYAVYAYFWVASGQGFKFGAALTNNPAGSLPLYSAGSTGVQVANAAAFSNVVKVVESDRTLYQVPLGSVSGTSLSVYIDDEADGGYSSSCWYDGIGYAVAAAIAPADVAIAASNAVMVVSWPETHKGWILQSAQTLTNAWSDISESTTNSAWNIPAGSPQASGFFRLRYPLP